MALESLAAQNAAPRPPVLHPGAVQGGAASKAEAAGEDQDMSFWDVLDIVNPLQHIPLVNSVYRAVTGDEIKPAMQIGGGILFGGVIGGVAAIANAALQEATGKDLGGHMMAGLGFGDDAPPAGQAAQLAAAPQPAPRPAQASGSQAQAAQTQAAQGQGVQTQRQPSPQLQQQMQQQQLQQQAMAAANAGAGAMGVPGMGVPGMSAGGMGPPGALSAGLSAAAGARPQGMDPNLVMNSGHTPAKMPKRDAMLASAMPRGSATSNLDRAPSVDRTGPTLPQNPGAANPQAAVQPTSANPVAANGTPANQVANQAAPAGRDAMAEIMMRNLAKYQAEKRAQNHTIRTSG